MSNLKFTGPARCFDCERDAFESVQKKTYREARSSVIRYEGRAAVRHAGNALDPAALTGRAWAARSRSSPTAGSQAPPRLLHRPCRAGSRPGPDALLRGWRYHRNRRCDWDS